MLKHKKNSFATRRLGLLPPLLGGLLLWALFSWPLPLHFGSAIPATEFSLEGGERVQNLVPCDALQLLYHFWLARDMVGGTTPPFTNLYEFNLGEGSVAPHFSPYYIPFSLFYMAIAPLFGDAAGWNFAGLVSVLLGVLGLYLLLLRFSNKRLPALLIALVANALPYRWIALLGGSPTGYAMALLPWLWLGVDIAVRDGLRRGGWLAGSALLASFCADLHTFYFGMLALPFWALFSWLATPAPLLPDRKRLLTLLRALLPLAILALVSFALSSATSTHLASTDMAGGRSWYIISRFSPSKPGFFLWRTLRPLGMANHIFFGAALTALFAFMAVTAALELRQRYKLRLPLMQGVNLARSPLLLALLALASLAVAVLALGANGPFGGLAMRAARALIPKYTMIRQAVKIYILLPLFLAPLALLLLTLLSTRRRSNSRWSGAAFALLALLPIAEFRLQLSPRFSGLPHAMPAYAAAVRDAAARAEPPAQGVVLPLWPGEAHWGSIYEYGIMHSRLRLLNGYSPSVPQNYYEEVFKRFESLNQGVIDDEQAAALRALGVRYIIFHEQPYPERVSPFPAAIALRRLLEHPLLEQLEQDGQMWCFRLLDEPRAEVAPLWGTPLYGATLRWNFSDLAAAQAIPARTEYALRTRAPVAPAPNLRYLMLLEGRGTLCDENGLTVTNSRAAANWIEAPFTLPQGALWQVAEGDIVLREALLTAGELPHYERGATLRWAAADLFHNGATDRTSGAITLEPLRDPQGLALHGPDLPAPAGRWRARLLSTATAPATEGREVGRLQAMAAGSGTILCDLPVIAGEPAQCEFNFDGLAPLRFEFHYHRRHAVRINAIEAEWLWAQSEGREDE